MVSAEPSGPPGGFPKEGSVFITPSTTVPVTTPGQVALLIRYAAKKIVLAYDADNAGGDQDQAGAEPPDVAVGGGLAGGRIDIAVFARRGLWPQPVQGKGLGPFGIALPVVPPVSFGRAIRRRPAEHEDVIVEPSGLDPSLGDRPAQCQRGNQTEAEKTDEPMP